MLATRISGLRWRGTKGSTQNYATKAEPAKVVNKSGPTPEMIHAPRLRRASNKKTKLETRKTLTPRMAEYFAAKHRPTKIKRSKTLQKLISALGSMPSPYDVDESKLTNAEFVDEGIAGEIVSSAKYWKISPQVIAPFKPTVNLTVKHGEKTTIYRGHAVESILVREKPSIQYEAKQDKFYTLMMVDPDIPLKSTEKDAWNHYTVVNVPGNDVGKGQVLADWIPPAPPKDTGVHRYIWLLLEQPSQIQFAETTQPSTDFNRVFQFADFLARYKLKPRGMSFHRTQFDNDVAALYQGWGASASGFNKKDYHKKLIIKQRQYQGM